MVDYNLKMEDIVSDYYQLIGKFNLITHNIVNKDLIIRENTNNDEKKIIEAEQKELLIDLGRVAELAFKYIIKIKRLEMYPNEPYNSSEQNKGFKDKETLYKAVVRDMGNQLHISQNVVDKIFLTNGIGPDAHNFNYLYTIINILFPEIDNSFKKFIELKEKSEIIKEELDYEDDLFKVGYISFPDEELGKVLNKSKIKIEDEILININKKMQTIKESGDIFTRLRYFSNNPNDKDFDIQKIYNLVSNIVDFVKAIHLNKENLNINPNLLFASYSLYQHQNSLRLKYDDIKKLMENTKIQNNPTILMDAIFYSDFHIDEILELLNLNNIDIYEYTLIFCEHIESDMILYLKSKSNDLEDIYMIKHAESELFWLNDIIDEEDIYSFSWAHYLSEKTIKTIKKFPEYFKENEFIKRISKGRLKK